MFKYCEGIVRTMNLLPRFRLGLDTKLVWWNPMFTYQLKCFKAVLSLSLGSKGDLFTILEIALTAATKDRFCNGWKWGLINHETWDKFHYCTIYSIVVELERKIRQKSQKVYQKSSLTWLILFLNIKNRTDMKNGPANFLNILGKWC